MKKTISTLVALTCFLGATQAQVQRGNVLVGGTLANLDLNLDAGGRFAGSISPKAAWFIRDGVAVGGYVGLGISTAKGLGTDVSYGVGALSRYYFNSSEVNTGSRKVRLFAEGTAGIEGFNSANGSNTTGLGLGIGPGLAYFITPNVGLEGLLKYNGIVGFGNETTVNNLNFGLGFQVYLGNRKVREIGKGNL